MKPIHTIDSLYLIGEKYTLPLTPDIDNMIAYERDEWATRLLYAEGVRVRENVYCTIKDNEVVIQNTDYKPFS